MRAVITPPAISRPIAKRADFEEEKVLELLSEESLPPRMAAWSVAP
jgi:hypothetical protein